MDPDPIVHEIRETGAKLSAEVGHDVHRFFERLRQAENSYRTLHDQSDNIGLSDDKD